MSARPPGRRDEDPGVPEALPRSLATLGARVGADAMDRVWIFPPMRRGRRESGLVGVSLFSEAGDRRRVVTLAYSAERTGMSLTIEPTFTEEGEAPPERLAVIMDGVVRRIGDPQGEPRVVEIGGRAAELDALLAELTAEEEESS